MDEAEIRRRLRVAGWDPVTLEVWRRAGYKCEYCGKNFIESPDDYYFGAHVDHIVPSAGDDSLNLALACRACNFIKRDKRFLVEGETLPASEIEGRALILSLATAYIASVRTENEKRLATDLQLLSMLDALPAVQA
jgi:hypothetical protein